MNNSTISSDCGSVVSGTSHSVVVFVMDRKRRSCKNSPNSFCYVCGEFTLKSQRRSITDNLKKAHYFYFGCRVGDLDKKLAPHVCCVTCYVKLTEWLRGKNNSMRFAVPMIWREPTSHLEDCYFCITKEN